jgi:hypothetical protein
MYATDEPLAALPDALPVPTIHLNGTSLASLLEAQRAVLHALRNAMAALRDAAPNARDYYPQGPAAFSAAQTAAAAEQALLQQIAARHEALATAIVAQRR